MIFLDGHTVSADRIPDQQIHVTSPLSGDGTPESPIGIEPQGSTTETVLWETSSPFQNNYQISLNDSIYNYDELIVCGSANRGSFKIDCQNRYSVTSGKLNMCDSYYWGMWSEAANTHVLANGTQVLLSGNTGMVTSSFYMGMNAGVDTWTGWKSTTTRQDDVHPYKIIGVKRG